MKNNEPSSSDSASPGAVPSHSGRLLEIDALRGLCATAVMLYHYTVRYDAMIGFQGVPNPAADVDRLGLRDVSTIPVYVFFMISGFVIYMTLEKVRSGGEFLASRGARIFPAYWAAVLLTYLSWEAYPVFAYHVTVPQMLVNLTMLQTFFYVPDVDGVYWSLGVEIAFYAGMYLLLISGRLNQILIFCAVWLAISTLYALVGDRPPFYYRAVLLFDLKYAHFFIIGILSYRIWRRRHGWADWLLLIACVPALFLHHAANAALIMTGFVGLFLLLAFGHLQWLAMRPLVFLGSISYSLYLVHQMIGYQIIFSMRQWPVLAISSAIVMALILATVMTRFVEQPAMRAIRASYKAWHRVRD